MSRWFVSCAFLIALSVLAQNSSSGYQPGTIMNVVKHSSALGDRQKRYDVSGQAAGSGTFASGATGKVISV